MGLDSFWQVDEETPGRIEDSFCLRDDGPVTNQGVSAFRGGSYDDIIEPLTGICLYEEKIENSVILEMNKKIQNCSFEKAKEQAPNHTLTPEEWRDFQKMWDAHASAGHYLAGWW
jgi:hypothetical protein